MQINDICVLKEKRKREEKRTPEGVPYLINPSLI
jgi:hypothetical protein